MDRTAETRRTRRSAEEDKEGEGEGEGKGKGKGKRERGKEGKRERGKEGKREIRGTTGAVGEGHRFLFRPFFSSSISLFFSGLLPPRSSALSASPRCAFQAPPGQNRRVPRALPSLSDQRFLQYSTHWSSSPARSTP